MANKVIAVIGHSRSNLLENCIQSLISATNHEMFTKILIIQRGHSEVEEIARKYQEIFNLVLIVNRNGSPTENISLNRYLAYTIGFEQYLAEYVTVLEDDVEISSDALIFSDVIFEKYKENRDFRAVNFGSGIPFDRANLGTYSRVRYALQGPASLLPKRSWDNFSLRKLIKRAEVEIFDGTFETYIQTGFVVMPNVSRYCDFGIGGTHCAIGTTSDYFIKIRSSWAGRGVFEPETFHEYFRDQNWRHDCKKYMMQSNFYYKLRHYVIYNRQRPILNILLVAFRRTNQYLRIRFFSIREISRKK